jgi:hypothetical protein
MWPFEGMSLSSATRWGDAANLVLIVCLIGGVIATFVIVRTSNIKEHHWDVHRIKSLEIISQLNNETAGLRAREPLVVDALKSAVDLTKTIGDTSNFLMTTSNLLMTVASELIKVAPPGITIPGALSVEKISRIISKTNRFSGTLFDAEIDIVSSDAKRLMLTGSLVSTLQMAGWIKVSGPEQPRDSVSGVVITVFPSNDTALLEAAMTLASALKAEDVEATVNLKSEIATAIRMIHMRIGAKP